jgi:hypothetical protein
LNSSKSLVQRPRVHRNPSEWQDIIHQFEQSGQTRDAFCADQSLALSTFSRWRSRLADSFDDMGCKAAGFVELSSGADPVTAPSPAPWDVELQLGADIIIRLRHQC